MLSIVIGFMVLLVGLGIVFLTLKKMSERNSGNKVVGVVVDNQKYVMQDAIHNRFKKNVVMYQAVYEIDTGTKKVLFVDTEITDSPLDKGIEKEFIWDKKNENVFYNPKSTMDNLKAGVIYCLVGVAMILLGFVL